MQWEKRLIFTCSAPALGGPWSPLVPALWALPDDDVWAQGRPAEGLITGAKVRGGRAAITPPILVHACG